MPFEIMLLRLAVATLLGGIIGYERDMHGRAAGLRTHTLVSIGSALFTLVSIEFSSCIEGLINHGDPGRIAAQVVTGIGFIGAGTILKSGVTIKGLTTAACLWLMAAIGMACAIGHLSIAVVVTFAAIIILTSAKGLEKYIPHTNQLKITVVTATFEEMAAIRDHLAAMEHIVIKELNISFRGEAPQDGRKRRIKALFVLESITSKNRTAFAIETFNSLRKVAPQPVYISLINNH